MNFFKNLFTKKSNNLEFSEPENYVEQKTITPSKVEEVITPFHNRKLYSSLATNELSAF